MNVHNFKTINALNPIIMAYLKDVPVGSFSYNNYELRHPRAIYNLTCVRLISSINELINKITNSRSKIELYNTHKLVLYNLFKFYDSCFEIMMCFTDVHKPPHENEFIWKWLVKNGYSESKDFFDNLKSDIEVLKFLYNKLKHTSNELKYFSVYNNATSSEVYTLELPNNNGGVYFVSNQNFPVSFNLELKKIHYIIYRISEELLCSIVRIVKRVHNINLKPSSCTLTETYFDDLFASISSLSDFYFPTEVDKTTFSLKLIESEGEKGIEFSEHLISSTTIEQYYKNNKLRIEAEFHGDGFTKEFSFIALGIKEEHGKFFIELKNGSTIEVLDPFA